MNSSYEKVNMLLWKHPIQAQKKEKKANSAILPKPSQGNLVVISSIKQYKFLQHRTLKKEIKKKTIETSS